MKHWPMDRQPEQVSAGEQGVVACGGAGEREGRKKGGERVGKNTQTIMRASKCVRLRKRPFEPMITTQAKADRQALSLQPL